jgi:DNA-binding NtrC family response regulator
MEPSRMLVVDDETQIRKVLVRVLQKNDYQVSSAATGEEALDLISTGEFELVLTDVSLPGISGKEVLQEVKKRSPTTAVIMMAGYGSLETAIQCIKLGAEDFLEKPFDTEHLLQMVRQALDRVKAIKAAGRDQGAAPSMADELVGDSRAVRELRDMVGRAGALRNPVLISGEPGAGKKLVARLIHQCSNRSAGPFVVLNCRLLGAAPKPDAVAGGTGMDKQLPDFFQQAAAGTLVFDEIGDLEPGLQSETLKLLGRSGPAGEGADERQGTDVRVIGLTSRNLRQILEHGLFSRELYSVLSGITIYIPPLREHIDDLPVLINHFLSRPDTKKPNAVSPEFLEILSSHRFPENVRELESIISHSRLLCAGPTLTPETLPAKFLKESEFDVIANPGPDQGLSLKQAKTQAFEHMEKKMIDKAMRQAQGNVSLASRKLGISRSALYYKLRKYQIDVKH